MGINFRKLVGKLPDFSSRLRTSDKSADLIRRLETGQNGGIF
jgi:hypothetical protein